jgi:hypothetical protein
MYYNMDTDYSFADIHIGIDERVLWKGKPEKGITVMPHDLALIPFEIFFAAFAVFWICMAAMASVVFAFFGIPFVLVGLYLAGGRFLVNERLKKSTSYVITNKAIIRKRGSRVNVWYSDDLINMQVFSHKNGTTSFIFSSHPADYRARRGERISFYGIENVSDAKGVADAIRQIKS